MKKLALITALTVTGLTSTPAFADSAVDTESMIDIARSAAPVEAYSLPVNGFELSALKSDKTTEFMATMSDQYQPGYRYAALTEYTNTETGPGLASLLVPEEFAFRSNSQDSGVDAALPGRFLSNSVRADYLTSNGPASSDKSSVGIRFGF